MLSLFYPIAESFVDWLAFGHRLSLTQWLGVAAILLAAAVLGRQARYGGNCCGALRRGDCGWASSPMRRENPAPSGAGRSDVRSRSVLWR